MTVIDSPEGSDRKMKIFALMDMFLSTLLLILSLISLLIFIYWATEKPFTIWLIFVLRVCASGVWVLMAFLLYFVGWRKKSSLICGAWVIFGFIAIILHVGVFVSSVAQGWTLSAMVSVLWIGYGGTGIWVVYGFAKSNQKVRDSAAEAGDKKRTKIDEQQP